MYANACMQRLLLSLIAFEKGSGRAEQKCQLTAAASAAATAAAADAASSIASSSRDKGGDSPAAGIVSLSGEAAATRQIEKGDSTGQSSVSVA